MTRLLNIGSINIDYVYQVSHFLRAGETLEAANRAIFMGGKGLNQSVAAKRSGIHTIIISEDNRKDVEDIKEIYVKGLTFVYVRTIDDVIKYIF